MKIAIIGASGFVGTNIYPYLINNVQGNIHLGFNKSKLTDTENSFFIDITDKKNTFETLSKIDPNIIIHLAAEANVDRSELNKESTYKLNKEGTRNIVETSLKIGSKVIMMSTDFVFTGKKKEKYNENSPTKAVNIEGDSKAEAERLLQENIRFNFAIIRISVPYGWKTHPDQKSFLDWVVTSLTENKRINLLTDQYNSPTSLIELGPFVEKIINSNSYGIFHAVAPEIVSRYEFGLKIAKIFSFDKKLINPITTDELKNLVPSYKAPRPMYCHLINNRSENELNFKTRTIEKNLEILKNIYKGD